jgi:hypothetical protein
MYLISSILPGGAEQALRLIRAGEYHRRLRKNDAAERNSSQRMDGDIEETQ